LHRVTQEGHEINQGGIYELSGTMAWKTDEEECEGTYTCLTVFPVILPDHMVCEHQYLFFIFS
jgi:hypothetical protein